MLVSSLLGIAVKGPSGVTDLHLELSFPVLIVLTLL